MQIKSDKVQYYAKSIFFYLYIKQLHKHSSLLVMFK